MECNLNIITDSVTSVIFKMNVTLKHVQNILYVFLFLLINLNHILLKRNDLNHFTKMMEWNTFITLNYIYFMTSLSDNVLFSFEQTVLLELPVT